MAAYSPHRDQDYQINAYELPCDLPTRLGTGCTVSSPATSPAHPRAPGTGTGNEIAEVMARWHKPAHQVRRSGWWPPTDAETTFLLGRKEMPGPPA